MSSRVIGVFLLAVFTMPAPAREELAICGTRPGNWREERFLHRQVLRARARQQVRIAAPRAALPDAGNIAILDDSSGAVASRNPFDLDFQTLAFTPSGNGYRFTVSGGGWDDGAAAS